MDREYFFDHFQSRIGTRIGMRTNRGIIAARSVTLDSDRIQECEGQVGQESNLQPAVLEKAVPHSSPSYPVSPVM